LASSPLSIFSHFSNSESRVGSRVRCSSTPTAVASIDVAPHRELSFAPAWSLHLMRSRTTMGAEFVGAEGGQASQICTAAPDSEPLFCGWGTPGAASIQVSRWTLRRPGAWRSSARVHFKNSRRNGVGEVSDTKIPSDQNGGIVTAARKKIMRHRQRYTSWTSNRKGDPI
jgi:hypothetical protein